ncbi:MAG: aminoacyl-tRNA hydrolase [Patescibacteria group bacterium]|nr:aminoacyl-tRNA hydrolase [Patescibacteria group bacterium]
MILIVGLGNPGKKFQKTRHNLGFRIVENFQKEKKFSNWKFEKEFKAEISKGILNSKKIILAKPQTFMNFSGKAVKFLINRYFLKKSKINAMASVLPWFENLWIVHDDIDLPLGEIRISKGRGAAGHKGVESIIKAINSKNFVRFRIGIQPKTGKPKNLEKFVLQKFNKKEEKIVKEVIEKTTEAIEMTIKEGIEKAMGEFNK